MSGYVRIHRTLSGHPAFRNDAEAMAFAWLVMKAQWHPAEVRYKGHCVKLERGQIALSIRDFASHMDRDKAWIERLVKRLRERHMIETARGTATLIITICNYNDYQTEKVRPEAVRETASETRARQRRDTEQVREEEKKEAIASCLKRAFVPPEDIPAEPWAAWEEMRKRLRKSPTDKARALAITELRRLRDEEGWPPGDVLNHCTMNSYQGIFPPRRSQGYERDNRDPTTVALERLIGGDVSPHARTG